MPNENQGMNVLIPAVGPVAHPVPVPLSTAAISDPGRSRSQNQDYAYAGRVPGAPDWTLLAVADGLGGHARGEWASQRAIELLAGTLGNALTEASSDPGAALDATISTINRTIHSEASGMGAAGAATTLVVVLIHGQCAWWANVGDSRLYRSTHGTLSQVSEDHSWVAEQVRSGRISASASRDHPEKNVVTRTVGFQSSVSVDVGGPLLLAEGEALLLCSDGLHGPVPDPEMSRCLGELSPNLAAERLVELANEAGGPDNITVVIGQVAAASAPPATTQLTGPAAPPKAKRRRRLRRWWISGAAAVLTGTFATVPVAVARFL